MEQALAPTQSGDELLVKVGRIALCYEEFGRRSDETILLIMGLGMQLLGWDENFCRLLADRGFHVIRFDNRDVGLSSKCSGRVNLNAGMLGRTRSAVYDLDDMAGDAAGLLDELGIERAHLVGASMGGMIAQKLAATKADRVLSLCSIMSSSGQRKLSTTPRPQALRLLLQPPASTREDFIESAIRTFTVIGSPGFPPDPERIRERASRSYDRCFYPAGTARQLMAIMASGNRTPELLSIATPTLVIHGRADPLVPSRAGGDVAAAIPDSRLELIDGMGHDLPVELWPHFVDLIESNISRSA